MVEAPLQRAGLSWEIVEHAPVLLRCLVRSFKTVCGVRGFPIVLMPFVLMMQRQDKIRRGWTKRVSNSSTLLPLLGPISSLAHQNRFLFFAKHDT
jgi:hypothetical protein